MHGAGFERTLLAEANRGDGPMANMNRVREIFEDAIGRTGDARRAHLDGACAGDAATRAGVEALFAAEGTEHGSLSEPTADLRGSESAGTMAASLREEPGSWIGPYRLLQLIGEGGFGSVFMAEQTAPVQRKVALKIIKLGHHRQGLPLLLEAGHHLTRVHGLDRFAEAEAELVDAERVLSTAQGAPRVAHRKCLEGLVLLYESWNAAEPGNRHDAKVAEWKARLDAASATPGGT